MASKEYLHSDDNQGTEADRVRHVIPTEYIQNPGAIKITDLAGVYGQPVGDADKDLAREEMEKAKRAATNGASRATQLRDMPSPGSGGKEYREARKRVRRRGVI